MASGVSSLSRLARAFTRRAGAGRLDADVAGEEEGFQLFEKLVVDLAPGKQRLELAAHWARVLDKPLNRRSRQEGARRPPAPRCWGYRIFEETEHGGSCLKRY